VKKSTQGSLLLGVSLFMLMGFFNANLPSPTSALLAFLIAVVLPGGIGSYLLYSSFQDRKSLSSNKNTLGRKTLEAEILSLARRKQGRLTVVEVVSQFALDKEDAEALLDSLARQGHADYEVTDSGLIVYTFHELLSLDDKAQSRRLEDA